MVKKYLLATLLLVLFLAAFVPFASNSPDGLETVVSSIGIKPQTLWQGLMNDYSVSALGNGYISTLLAGSFGTLFVLTATFALGKVISKRSQTETKDPG
jgi:hypothetical protein